MKIGLFVYDFEHARSYEGISMILSSGFNIECILAAPWQRLNIPKSTLNFSPKAFSYIHPREVAFNINVPYYSVVHNSAECGEIIEKYKLDLGIILGSRILKKFIIDSFNIGILNPHQGLLPENRGLDNFEWAIIRNIPQGVTCHLIEKKVDWGSIVNKDILCVYKEDSFSDIFLRTKNLEMKLLRDAIISISKGTKITRTKEMGVLNPSFMSVNLQQEVREKFEFYKSNYRVLIDEYNRRA